MMKSSPMILWYCMLERIGRSRFAATILTLSIVAVVANAQTIESRTCQAVGSGTCQVCHVNYDNGSVSHVLRCGDQVFVADLVCSVLTEHAGPAFAAVVYPPPPFQFSNPQTIMFDAPDLAGFDIRKWPALPGSAHTNSREAVRNLFLAFEQSSYT